MTGPDTFVASRRVGRWRAQLERRSDGYKLPVAVNVDADGGSRRRATTRVRAATDPNRRPEPGERPEPEPRVPDGQINDVAPTAPVRPVIIRSEHPTKVEPPAPTAPWWMNRTPAPPGQPPTRTEER